MKKKSKKRLKLPVSSYHDVLLLLGNLCLDAEHCLQRGNLATPGDHAAQVKGPIIRGVYRGGWGDVLLWPGNLYLYAEHCPQRGKGAILHALHSYFMGTTLGCLRVRSGASSWSAAWWAGVCPRSSSSRPPSSTASRSRTFRTITSQDSVTRRYFNIKQIYVCPLTRY